MNAYRGVWHLMGVILDRSMAWRFYARLYKSIRIIIFPCAGKAGMSWLYLSKPCAFSSTFAHGAAGAVGARLSLRPLLDERDHEMRDPGENESRE